MLTATVGKSFTGDIAVDDVTFTDEMCEEQNEPGLIPQGACNTLCFVKQRKLNHKVCHIELFIKLLYFFQGNCNFDLHFCHWTKSYNFDFNWTRRQYGTPSINTGPNSDHTSGSVTCTVVVDDVLSLMPDTFHSRNFSYFVTFCSSMLFAFIHQVVTFFFKSYNTDLANAFSQVLAFYLHCCI